MFRKFVNRKTELQFLEKKYGEKNFQFIVIYGRRRVGKTELVKKFIKNKPHIYSCLGLIPRSSATKTS